MNATPTVSWLLPIKNGMPFLAEALSSIAMQSFRDFEVLAWDNGSSDGSVDELRRWIPSRVSGRVCYDRPLPLSESLAALVDTSRSEFCARLDADDRARPERLARQVDYLERHSAVAAISSLYQAIDVSGASIPHGYRTGCDYPEIQDILLRYNGVLHPAVTFRRSAVLALGNYRWPSPLEDYDLWLRLCAKHELHCLPDAMTEYRVSAHSVTGKLDSPTLFQALDRCWLANAAGFAGIADSQTASEIRHRRCPWLLPHLVAIARHLGRRDGINVLRRFFRPDFVASGLFLCGPNDWVTRKFLRLCEKLS